MASKLTLYMDEELIAQARRLARERGQSVSRLVAEYVELLGRVGEVEESALPPITRSLRGTAAGSAMSEDDYRRHLEEKHR